MTWLEILAQCAWRGTIVLAAAFAAARLFGRGPRRSAALRHFIWTAAFAALLSLPLAVAGLARWQWTATAAPAGAPVQTLGQVLAVVGNRAARPPAALPASLAAPLLALWMLGCSLTALRALF